MKKIIIILFSVCVTAAAFAQGNSGHQNNSNNWGQNGNGNAYGQSNGNNGNNGNGDEDDPSGDETNVVGAASQSTNVALSNAIEVTFTGNNSDNGVAVNLPFTTVNHYANGVESSAQELKVRSNKNFTVAVKAGSGNFSYVGTTTPAPVMPVSGVLALMMTANSTGGTIASPFSTSAYSTLTSSNQSLITGASRGGNQTFSVKYKATPGFAYPAGTYSVDVVYTATQQ